MQQIFSLKTRIISTLIIVLLYVGLFWFYKSRELGELVNFFFTTSWYFGAGIGGTFAIFAAIKHGLKNSIGKFLLFAGLGLLSSLMGTLIWDYHIFILLTDTPYPSSADIFYLLVVPFIALALLFLLKSYSVTIKKGIVWFGIVLAIGLFVFFVTIQGHDFLIELTEGSSSIALTNILYNIYDSIILPMSLVAILLIGGKLFKGFGLFVTGVLLQAIANLTFGFRNFYEIYYFGDFSDLLFVLSSVVMSIGVIVIANQMYSKKSK